MEIYKIIQAFLWPQLFCCLIALIIVFLIYFIPKIRSKHGKIEPGDIIIENFYRENPFEENCHYKCVTEVRMDKDGKYIKYYDSDKNGNSRYKDPNYNSEKYDPSDYKIVNHKKEIL